LLLNPCALPAWAEPALLTASSYAQRVQLPGSLAFASCGPCESTTDLVMSGLAGIAQGSQLLAETQPLQFSTQSASIDVNLTAVINTQADQPTQEKSTPATSQTPLLPARIKMPNSSGLLPFRLLRSPGACGIQASGAWC